MDKNQIREMTGQKSANSGNFYPLNELRMSGDDGSFSLVEFLKEKGADGKYSKTALGNSVKGVILNQKWRLQKFVEGQGYVRSTEYNDKRTDSVRIFPQNDFGLAVDMKEKYALSTQRVVYFYLPERQEVVRLIVKASALSGEKNPDKSFGLFDYLEEMNAGDFSVNEYLTTLGSVHRPDPTGNKRKDYYAMNFARGAELETTEVARMQDLVVEVFNKTKVQKAIVAPIADEMPEADEDAPDPSQIPF